MIHLVLPLGAFYATIDSEEIVGLFIFTESPNMVRMQNRELYQPKRGGWDLKDK